MKDDSDIFLQMINRNHTYNEPTSQTLDKALRDAPIDYPKIGHVEEYFLPFIYSIHNSNLRMNDVL